MRATPAFFCQIVALAVTTATRIAGATEPAPQTPDPSSGLMVGVTLSYFGPALSEGAAVSPGPAVGVSAGYRWRFLYVGAAYQHVFFGGTPYGDDDTSLSAQVSSDYGGIELVAITSPDALIAAFFRVGVGDRVIRGSDISFCAPPNSPPLDKWQESNLDLTLLGIGVQINAGGWLRIVPQASLEWDVENTYFSLGVTTYFDFAKLTTAPF